LSTSINVDDLGEQLSLIRALNDTLINFQKVNEATTRNIESQANVFSQLGTIYSNLENSSNQLMQNFDRLHKTLNSISQKKAKPNINPSTVKELEKTSTKIDNGISQQQKQLEKISQQQKTNSENTQQQFDDAQTQTKTTQKNIQENIKSIHSSNILMKFFTEKINKFKENIENETEGFKSNPYKIIFDILKSATSIVFNLFSSVTSLVTDFIKLTFSLPFMFGSFANQIGTSFRKKIIEQLGNATEQFKETVSFNSSLGKNVLNLSNEIKNSINKFTILNERVTQIFGYENETQLLDEANKILSGLGMFSEVFGKNLSTMNSILYLKEAQLQLGIGIQELNYYALNAYVNIENINDQLHKTMVAISETSKKFNIDSKSISSIYHKLRLNIQEFGHFSEFELSEMSAKLIKLRVKTEDVTGIFSRISSFESAADVSTKLFQSFGALIDAYDLLTAEDPAKMITMLRDSMFKTGKQFATLNRHEKQLMQQITGLSAETLNTIMNFKDMSMSQEDIRQKLNQENPFDVQLKITKQLTNSIKELKKVLDFTNPFEAIFKGIAGNAAYQENVIKLTQNYSQLLENINQSIRKIDPKLIQKITMPLIIIIEKFKKSIFDGELFKIIKDGLKTISDFIQGIFTISTKSNVDDILLKYKIWYSKLQQDNKTKEEEKIIAKLSEAFKKTTDPLHDFTNDLIKSGFLIKNKEGTLSLKQNIDLEILLSKFVSESSKNEDLGKLLLIVLENKQEDDQFFTNRGNQIDLQGHVLKQLTDSLIEMMKQGGPLFLGIYNIGSSIMSALIKTIIIGSTSFLNVVNGKLSSLQTNDQDTIQNFTGIKQEEFKTMSEKFSEEMGKFIIELLPKFFNLACEVIKTSASFIYNLFIDIFTTLLSSVYENANEFQRLVIKQMISSNTIKMIQTKEEIEKKLKENEEQTKILEQRDVRFDREAVVAYLKIYENSKEIKNLIETLKNLNDQIKITQQPTKVNDASIIRIDDKDYIELIASKDTGLLVTSYEMIREKYNQLFNDITIKVENGKFNNEVNMIEDEEKYMISLIDKFGIFIDEISNDKLSDKVTISKLNFAL